jgi:hypothetical protein
MPSEVICPTCGRPVRIDEGPAETEAPVPEAACTVEVVVPGTITSQDEIEASSVSVAAPAPDHVLGAFVAGDPVNNGRASQSPEGAPLAVHAAPESEGLPAAPFISSISVLNAQSSSSTSGSALGLESSEDDDDSEPDDDDGRGRWAWVLLASYASALTLALAWLFVTGRVRLRQDVVGAMSQVGAQSDEGSDIGGSRPVAKAPAIPNQRITKLGQRLTVGDLEITPLRVYVAPVTLRRLPLDAQSEVRRDGDNALCLRIRLKNLSTSAVFAPLEESFVRERDRDLPDSFIETGLGARIDMYPLARESEWSIVGQQFKPLGPGESVETLVVTQPDARGLATPEMTWRLRLRTGAHTTDVVGVRLSDREISKDGG